MRGKVTPRAFLTGEGHCRRWAHLVALILGSEGVPKAQPGRGKAGVHGGGLAKVLPRAVVAANGLIVAPHRKPGHNMLRVLLHQPAELRQTVIACMQACIGILLQLALRYAQKCPGSITQASQSCEREWLP